MADVPVAMISSTAADLPQHRTAAMEACLRKDYLPKMMEHLAPSPQDSLARSYALVDEADLYVLILGLRYGSVPDGHERSYTHLELDRAVARGIPIIVMLSGPDHMFTQSQMDMGAAGERVFALREQACRHGYSLFGSPDDLRAQLIDGLGDIRGSLVDADVPDTSSPHHVHRPDPPPAAFVAHPYTLLETAGVVGRRTELGVLSDWVSTPGSDVFAARVLVVVAIGGMGKSAVTWKWFQEIAPLDRPGLAGRVWWSFYESDATFENFVLRTLAYVSGLPAEDLLETPAPQREDALIEILDREPFLVVLDGLERLLVAYTRPDAARLADDDDLDEQTAHIITGALGLPSGAATSFTGKARLRLTADPRVGVFLRRLCAVRAGRVLVTSRLFPTDLQTTTLQPVPGAAATFLTGLDPEDAVDLWRRLGGSGSRDELTALFAAFDHYPLLVRALAGEVARFRPAPGDLAAWRAANPGFDPFRLPLVQRKTHVLEHALAGLDGADQRVLHTVAAFRSPTTYDTLVALLVGPDGPCADEAALDLCLTGLEERGLLGWDRRANRYDLHPVVRGVAWAALGPTDRHAIDERLATHFESLPVVQHVTSRDQLTVPIELFHTLVRLGRLDDAFDLLGERLFVNLFVLGAFRESAELGAEIVRTAAGRDAPVGPGDGPITAAGTLMMAMAHQFTGDAGRSNDAYADLLERASAQDGSPFADGSEVAFATLRAVALLNVGRVAEADGVALALVDAVDDDAVGLAIAVHGSFLARTGHDHAGLAWLTDYRAVDDDLTLGFAVIDEICWSALRGDDDVARELLATFGRDPASFDDVKRWNVVASVLGDRLALRDGQAVDDPFSAAILTSRTYGIVDLEIVALIAKADHHLATGRLPAARENVDQAIDLAERTRLRPVRADALCVRARIEMAAGDRSAAADAARSAYRDAWLDGPPFCYAAALETARRVLAELGEPPPPMPPPAGRPAAAPLHTRPAPPLVTLDLDLAGLCALRWARPAEPVPDVVAAVHRSGWFAAADETVAQLAGEVIGPGGPHAVTRLLRPGWLEPAEQADIAIWLTAGGTAHSAIDTLPARLGTAVPRVRVLLRQLSDTIPDETDRSLFSALLDSGTHAPATPPTPELMTRMAETLAIRAEDVHRRYGRLAARFGWAADG